MIGMGFLCASLFCSVIWVFMQFAKMRVLNGLWRETWMFGSVGFAALGVGLMAMGL